MHRYYLYKKEQKPPQGFHFCIKCTPLRVGIVLELSDVTFGCNKIQQYLEVPDVENVVSMFDTLVHLFFPKINMDIFTMTLRLTYAAGISHRSVLVIPAHFVYVR